MRNILYVVLFTLFYLFNISSVSATPLGAEQVFFYQSEEQSTNNATYFFTKDVLYINNTPYLPARDIGVALGGNLKWYAKEKIFVLASNKVFACFSPEKKLAIVKNNKNILKKIPQEIAFINNTMFLPINALDIFNIKHGLNSTIENVYLSTWRHVYEKELNAFALEAFELLQAQSTILGAFSTYFNANYINRTTNIKAASKALDGVIIEAGELFSFNGTVGPRTPKAGYKKAIIFVNKKKVEDYGGGVCQVSSTLFNAVEKAKLNILKRQSHSLDVTYVPKGKDATVSYGYIDFVFKNNKPYPIMLNSEVKGKRLSIKVLRY